MSKEDGEGTVCPACGLEVMTTLEGEVYSHADVIDCNYSGDAPITDMGIFPMKFEYRPLINLTAAYMAGEKAATIRYGDYSDLTTGDRISIRTGNGDVVGVGTVEGVSVGNVASMYAYILETKVRYPIKDVDSLISRLNEYYDEEIRADTRVRCIVFTPSLAHCPR